MFVLKNRIDPGLSETNFRATLNHSKQLLKNIHPTMLSSFLFTDEKIFGLQWPRRKEPGRIAAFVYIHQPIKEERRRDAINV